MLCSNSGQIPADIIWFRRHAPCCIALVWGLPLCGALYHHGTPREDDVRVISGAAVLASPHEADHGCGVGPRGGWMAVLRHADHGELNPAWAATDRGALPQPKLGDARPHEP